MKKRAYVTVQEDVTDLRSEPTKEPFITNGHDRRRESQVLRGTCLHVVREQDGWVEVEVPYQRVGTNLHPYRGWVYAGHLQSVSRCCCINPVETGDRQDLIQRAESYLGIPYLWGGMGCEGIDCSGLVYQAYLAAGMLLPRNAGDQYRAGKVIERPQRGDLVFIGMPICHVLIWDGKDLIEATDKERSVVRSISFQERFGVDLEASYDGMECKGEKIFFRRLLPPAASPA